MSVRLRMARRLRLLVLTVFACPVGSECGESRGNSEHSDLRGKIKYRCSVCAWDCSAWLSSSPEIWQGCPRHPRVNLIRTHPTPLLRRWPNRWTLLRTETSGEPCDWGSTRPNWYPDQLSLSSTAQRWCRSDTATAMRSTTPTATGSRRPGCSSQDFHPTETSWNSWSFPAMCTPTTWQRKRTPSCGVDRIDRTHSSADWSRRHWSGMSPANSLTLATRNDPDHR